MDNRKAKKFLLCIIVITFLLALVVVALPMDSLAMGYYSKNGVTSLTYKPKLEGILIACSCSVLMYFLCIVNNKYMGMISEEQKAKMKNSNLLYLLLSPLGAIMLIVNLVLYFL